MKLREFADMLTDREYGHEITKEEESLAKELGFVVVFGYSDDNAELRGAIDDEIGCFDGGVLEHKDLQGTILAEWCPEDIDCSWHFSSTQPSEKFYIYEGEELYCVGIVIDNNKTKPKTNADRIRAMSDEELAKYITNRTQYQPSPGSRKSYGGAYGNSYLEFHEAALDWLYWLQQPAKDDVHE